MYTTVIMNTVLNVKIDPKLKKEAQEVAKAIGLPVSTVVSASLREFVRTRSITISDEATLKPEVVEELLEISKKARQGIDISPPFESVEDSFKWLDAQ